MKRSWTAMIVVACALGFTEPSIQAQTSLTVEQIHDLARRAGLTIIASEESSMGCGPVAGGNPSAIERHAPSPYQLEVGKRWRSYVADHVRSNTPFDSSYDQIAADAEGAIANIYMWDGVRCVSVRQPDQEERRNTHFSAVGIALFNSFKTMDEKTRTAAADYIATGH
jgi:hypothetical protein